MADREEGKIARVEHCDEMICFDRPACNLFLVRVGPGGICIASHKEKAHADLMAEAINRPVTRLIAQERKDAAVEALEAAALIASDGRIVDPALQIRALAERQKKEQGRVG